MSRCRLLQQRAAVHNIKERILDFKGVNKTVLKYDSKFFIFLVMVIYYITLL